MNAGRTCLAALFVLSGVGHVRAELVPSTIDLWDISQGASIRSNSQVQTAGGNSDIRNMFGGSFGSPEAENTVFRDYQDAGALHWVQWETPQPVTLRSFVLFAAHDGPPYDANQRGLSRFTLYAYNDGTEMFDQLFEILPANPYGETVGPDGAVIETNQNNTFLNLAANVVPTTAQRFLADFVQYGDSIPEASGPRIVELDGFDAIHPAVPEPSTLVLLAMGAVGLLAYALRKRRYGCTSCCWTIGDRRALRG